MKRVVFAGCSFTHSGDSWAYCARPWNFLEFDQLPEKDKPLFMEKISKQQNLYTRVEWHSANYSYNILKDQFQKYKTCYNISDHYLNPDNFWDDSKLLPIDDFEINIFGRGANSNIDNVRAVIHFIENYDHPIDTVVFQITGFTRRELYTSDVDILNEEVRRTHADNITTYDDVNFIKQWGAIDFSEVQQENPAPNYFRKASAYFYSKIFEPEEYHIRAIEALQSLVTFCKSNNIKLGLFHGWDNYPNNHSDYDDTKRGKFEKAVPSEYFKKKYNRYVLPNLISKDSIISYAEKNLPDMFVFDIMNNMEHGGHPSPIAHKKYWNDIVYPFVI